MNMPEFLVPVLVSMILMLSIAFLWIRQKLVCQRLPAGGPPPKPLFPKLSFFAMNCMDGTPLDGIPVPSYQDFEQHMKLLFSDFDEEIYLRLLQEANKKRPVKEIRTSLRRLQYDWPEIERYNRAGYGVFVMVNQMPAGAKGNDRDITGIRAFFWEHDEVSKEEQWEMARKMPMQPSFCIESKRSIHFYYLVIEADVENFRQIQRMIARLNGSDSTLQNPSRILRCAGTLHSKNPEHLFLCRLLEVHPERVYTEAEFKAMLDEKLPEEPAVERYAFMNTRKRIYPSDRYVPKLQSKEHLQILIDNCDFIEYCRKNAIDLPEPLWRSMLSNLLRFESGEDAAHEFSKDYPGYSVAETQDKMEAIKSSKVGPIRCDTIREYGFDCPKHCGCAAPAALPWLLDDKSWDRGVEPWYTVNKTRWTLNTDEVLEVLRWAYPAYSVNGQFYIYRSGCYRPTKPEIVKWQYISGYLHEGQRSVRMMDEIYTKWVMSVTLENGDIFNNDEEVINLANGIFSLQDNALYEHTPDLLSSIQLNAAYTPGANCPRFLRFLSDVLEPDLIPVVQEMFGYCLTVSVKAQRGFILFGKARAGKSTLLLVLLDLIGEDNACHLSLQELEERFRSSRLEGKLLNECTDLPVKPLLETSVAKKAMAGEQFETERKGKDLYALKPFSKFVFSCNDLPANYADRSNGLYRRLILIPFLKSVPEKDMNVNLLSELTAERDGILLWAIEGLQRLKANGHKFSDSPSVTRALEQYRFESSPVLRFVEECCTINPHFEESRNFLYKFYQAWCLQNGMKPLSNPNFVKEMEREFPQLVFKKDTRTKRALWCGIKFNYLEQRPLIDQIRDKLTAEEIQALDDLFPF